MRLKSIHKKENKGMIIIDIYIYIYIYNNLYIHIINRFKEHIWFFEAALSWPLSFPKVNNEQWSKNEPLQMEWKPKSNILAFIQNLVKYIILVTPCYFQYIHFLLCMEQWPSGYQITNSEPMIQNHWVTPRATLPFMFLRSIKQVPGTPRDLGLK